MNVWEKNSKRLRRQAEFRRIDERLQAFHNDHPVLFNMAVAVVAAVITLIAFGIVNLLDKLAGQ